MPKGKEFKRKLNQKRNKYNKTTDTNTQIIVKLTQTLQMQTKSTNKTIVYNASNVQTHK